LATLIQMGRSYAYIVSRRTLPLLLLLLVLLLLPLPLPPLLLHSLLLSLLLPLPINNVFHTRKIRRIRERVMVF